MNLATDHILQIFYLLGSITFIVGLKMMSHPKTARNGNLIAAAGMFLAVAGTIFFYNDPSGLTSRETIKIVIIVAAIVLGSLVGWLTAKKVKMTAMPQLVSIFNGMGGACAALIGLREFHHNFGDYGAIATIIAGIIIGSVSFTGSIVAFLKLNGTMKKNLRLPSYNLINNIVALAVLCAAVFTVAGCAHDDSALVNLTFVLAMLYGVLFVVPIGGADMPVVISLLNSFTGLAAAAAGFLFHNLVMITGGILVGSAGTLLTIIMCKAMNRSLSNVVFGAFGETRAAAAGAGKARGAIKDTSASDAAVLMNYSKKIVVVPGYGLAVAQAQHTIRELESVLEEKGIEVKYGIHPVAGRMPGHMNVLLAEANVDYDKLLEMDTINPEFATTDVVLVVGANDVVNPAAKNDPSSPIYGMPILEVENAAHIIIVKRSMNTGYAGIENELFYNPKTSMLFGDAKKVLTDLVNELKKL
jgi:H+-translocating NAD(P) transhydrogenase subunit beta